MKQSTKLLSLVLAIVMAFSCMSVIGSAADTIGNAQAVAYDSIDDALLTGFCCCVFYIYHCKVWACPYLSMHFDNPSEVQASLHFTVGVLKIWRLA